SCRPKRLTTSYYLIKMCRTSTACNSSATPARLSRDETRRSSCSLPVSAVPRPAESARTCFYRNRKASIVSSQRSPPYSIRLRGGWLGLGLGVFLLLLTAALTWHGLDLIG